ncbi:MAG: MoaD/ThiS family protein [Motiliproteus sp.]|nr:MoaD/ThiS family protein [Motiliproteus sp.]MCW9052332.1 MoaD/ThiS family protein [Motiliproteus sp.]
MIKLVYFASIREQLDCAEEQLMFAGGQVRDVISLLTARGAPWDQVLEDGSMLVAINQEMSQLDAPVKDGDEVAFFPPVTGG